MAKKKELKAEIGELKGDELETPNNVWLDIKTKCENRKFMSNKPI